VRCVSGGITNNNYRLEAERGRFMLRVAGERTQLLGINRAHEYACATTAHQVGVGAEPIAYLQQHAAILTRFIDDALTLTPESAMARLEQIVTVLKRCHAAPAFPSGFDAFQTVRNYRTLALEHGVRLPDDLPEILEEMNQIETALRPHAHECACHNDLLPANFLDDGANIWIVDWEYAGNGNVFFDLGNLAVNFELDTAQCERLVALYFGHSSEMFLAQLGLMRLASDLREAFWGFLQSGISALEFDFVGYSEKHLDRFRENVSRAEYARWLEVLGKEIPPLR
jgi:thiamine kinase-like enzyme